MNDFIPYPLPSAWEWTKLGEICEIVRVQVQPKLRPRVKFNYLSIENIESISGDLLSFTPTLGEKIKSSKIAFTTGDILYSKLRPYLNKVHLPTFDGISATDLIPIRPLGGIPREYVGFFLRTKFVVEYAKQRTRGIQLPRVPVEDLLKLPIPLPPLTEQKRIAEKLETSIKFIRVAKKALGRIPSLAAEFRQSVLTKAFHGELTERDPNDEPAKRLLERLRQDRRKKWEEGLIAKGKDPRKYEYEESEPVATEDLPKLPEGWVWSRVEWVAEVRLGRQRSPKNRSDKYPTKYLRAANVREDEFDLSDVKEMDFKPNEFETYKLRSGDVLLSEGSGTVEQSNRTLGTCAVWDGRIPDCCIQNTLIRVRSDYAPSRYFLHVFTYARYKGDFARIAKGIGIAHLGGERLASYLIPIAPRNEMSRIVEKIDSLFSMARTTEQSTDAAGSSAAQLEQSILSKAFSGGLVTQDPNDEPASILLEKIRTQNEEVSKKEKLQAMLQ